MYFYGSGNIEKVEKKYGNVGSLDTRTYINNKTPQLQSFNFKTVKFFI